MQDAEALERTAADLVEDKARDHVRYAEMRWAPLLHTDRGLTGRQVVEATWRGADAMARVHGIEVRLIATLLRSHAPEANLAFVEEMAANGMPDGLVAVDLAGQEARFPDPELTGRRSITPGPSGCTSRSTPASGAVRPRSGGRSRSTRSGSHTGRSRSTTRRWSPS